MEKLETWASEGEGRQYTAVRNADGSALVVLIETAGGVVRQVTKVREPPLVAGLGLAAVVDLALSDWAEGKFLKDPDR